MARGMLQPPAATAGTASRRLHVCRAATSVPAPSAQISPQSTAFLELARSGQVQLASGLVLAQGELELGLMAQQPVAKGQVLVRVPRGLALTVDYQQGLSLPAGRWPRLREGLDAAEPLPWDLLLALGLMDALAGDGAGFWQAYSEALLPDPDRLTLPMCLSEQRLQQLQHSALADGAREQQARLARLFPHLVEPLGPDLPSWLQWGFACVRSRAFKVGEEAFSFIPFLDLANHSDTPNADFRASPAAAAAAGATAGSSGAGGDGASLELVAVQDIAAGQEVTISYSGPGGYTNQRWMAQYGFVPAGGNMADRVALEVAAGSAALDLAQLQEVVGDELFVAALQGKNKYLFAALKSLPLVSDDAAGGQASSASADSRRTAAELLRQVERMQQEGAGSSLQDDEAIVEGAGAGALRQDDCRLAAALRYQLERKRLLEHCRVLLAAYARGA